MKKIEEGLVFRGLEEPQEKYVKPFIPKPKLSDEELIKSLTKTLPYDIKWAVALIRHSENGGSIESFCSTTGITPSQFEKWKDIPEFNEAFRMAQASIITYWEEKLEEALVRGEDSDINKEIIKVCRFKLESLGYGNKTYELNKMVFKDSTIKKSNKTQISMIAQKDLALLSKEEVDSLTKLYLEQDDI